MLTPALMQPLASPSPLVPPSPVRPAAEPMATAQKSAFRSQEREDRQRSASSDPLAGWQTPARGETAFAAQQLAQDTEAQAADETAAEALTDEELALVADLKARDAEVRAHEQAHKQVGGRYAGAPSYETTRGPDGQRYAIGGEVSIDVSPEGTPDETIAKMIQVKAAALAPAEPSPQDRSVAALADGQRMQAMAEKQAQSRAEQGARDSESGATVVEFHYSSPPTPMVLRGLAAYGQSLAMTAPPLQVPRTDAYDLVA